MTETVVRQKLVENLESVRLRITTACQKAGRQPEDVTLVAVTKLVSPRLAGLIYELGVRDFGESRPQELWRKAEALPSDIRWHLIGHLQRNKIEKTVPLTALIHSADSKRLIAAINKWAEHQNRIVDLLIEVNLSGEDAKTGMSAAEAEETGLLADLSNVNVDGLMTMAALQDPENCRPTFRALRHLRDRMRDDLGLPLRHLSMGMSNDFEVAIEEGATLVRIGSCLWEGLPDEALQA